VEDDGGKDGGFEKGRLGIAIRSVLAGPVGVWLSSKGVSWLVFSSGLSSFLDLFGDHIRLFLGVS
jgi:hypothetical protein